MSLQDDLDALRADFVRSAPPGRAELYDAKVEELRRTFPIEQTLRTGNYAPDFTLPNPSGRPVSLAGLLRGGPAVVTFYRGGWCPYCNLQLRAYQQVLGEITALGAKLVAISPQLPDGSMSTAEMNRLSIDVLSDIGNRVARSFGLVYSLPQNCAPPWCRTIRRCLASTATRAGNCRCLQPMSSRQTAGSRSPRSSSITANVWSPMRS